MSERIELVECSNCRGEGGWYEPEQRFSRWHLDPPCEVFEPCPECWGAGLVEGIQQLDLADLEERCTEPAPLSPVGERATP